MLIIKKNNNNLGLDLDLFLYGALGFIELFLG
jgi:hypothetical protein